MKKQIVSRRNSLDGQISGTDNLEKLLQIGEDARTVHCSIAIRAYRKAISLADSGWDFAQIIRHLSHCCGKGDSAGKAGAELDCGPLCDEAALAGARKFQDQLRWRKYANDKEARLWQESDIRIILEAIEEFLGNYILIEKILDPGIKGDTCDIKTVAPATAHIRNNHKARQI